jgi:outer membrane lipoprotein SlyB
MEGKPNRIHPLVAAAAVSVTIASLAAVAALTGILPGSHAETTPSAQTATTATATEPPVAAEPPATAKLAPPAPVATHAAVPHKPASHPARAPDQTVVAEQTPPPPPPPPVCHNCGTVESIREIVQKGEGTGLGAVAGGILGGVLGHQVGNGRGNDAATVIGAVGGAVAGNAVEKSQRKTVHYEISVRMDDGGYQTITTKGASTWHEGDHVKVVNGALIAADQAY